MPHKFWVVMIDEGNQLRETRDDHRFLLREDMSNDWGVFFDEARALRFAKQVAARNSGKEVMVAESTSGFYAPPQKELYVKKWVKNEYILEGQLTQ